MKDRVFMLNGVWIERSAALAGSRLASLLVTQHQRRLNRVTSMSTPGRNATVENTESIPGSRSRPVLGDVLVSERTARADVYAISLVPGPPLVVARRYSDAIRKVRDLARARQVDGWYTGDQTHYAQVARYRTPARMPSPDSVASPIQ